jgi:threonine synthase
VRPSALIINPLVRRALCSATGREIDVDGWQRPLGLSPYSGKPIVLEYDLERARSATFGERRGLPKFEALLPVSGMSDDYAADVGDTQIVWHQRLSRELGVELHLKNESGNPTGSFKDRGLAVGVALGALCGARRFCLPTQGNAGIAAALFSARLGLEAALVYMPDGYQGSFYHRACELYGAHVRFFGKNIAAAGTRMREDLRAELERGDAVDISTFFEPGRLEGKKTMGFEIWQHFGSAELPEWVLYPTGGGTGLVGIWKAFRELSALGQLEPSQALPRMVAVQARACAPVVRAFERGLADVEPVESEGTIADGLDVPKAIMGARMLAVLRESKGSAIDVSESAILEGFRDLAHHGVNAGTESAALLAALRELRARNTIVAGSRVLLLITSGPYAALSRLDGTG